MKHRGLALGLFLYLAVWAPPALSAQDIRVTLLGTGIPIPALDRFGPSILVEAGPKTLLFDVGRGAAQRLFQLGVPYTKLSAIFFTHLHSDHVVGLPDFWLTGWLLSGRGTAVRVFGPMGTADMTRHLEEAYRFDTEVRIREGKAPVEGSHLAAKDIVEGVVFEEDSVRVTAFLVDHGATRPAFGYRVDYARRSVVLSGDTRFSPNLIAHAKGADLLVHEVAAATAEDLSTNANIRRIVGHHTTPERAGEVFDKVRPKLAVYSHIALFGGVRDSDLVQLTRTRYAGPLIVGHDLMTFEVGDTVRVVEALSWADPSPHRVQFVSVAPEVRLEVLDWGGAGPPLVLLSGLQDVAHGFDEFAPRFTDKYHVLAITRRGYGASSQSRAGYDLASRVADLRAVLDSLRLPRVVLVGHSIAGDELTAFAGAYPARVSGLVYLDAAYDHSGVLAILGASPAPPSMGPMDSASPSAVQAYLQRVYGMHIPVAQLRAIGRYDAAGRLVADVTPGVIDSLMLAGCGHPNYAAVRAPALVIDAVVDSVAQVFPTWQAFDAAGRATALRFTTALQVWAAGERARVRRELPAAQLLELHGANHYVFDSHPAEVTRAMRAFLAHADE